MHCRGCLNQLTELDVREWNGFCYECCCNGRCFDDLPSLEDANFEPDYSI